MVFIGPPNQMLPNERSIGETAAYSKRSGQKLTSNCKFIACKRDILVLAMR